MSNRAPFLSAWFIFAALLVLGAAVIAYGNIHLGPVEDRLSPWNWAGVGVMAALVLGARCYQYFVQRR